MGWDEGAGFVSLSPPLDATIGALRRETRRTVNGAHLFFRDSSRSPVIKPTAVLSRVPKHAARRLTPCPDQQRSVSALKLCALYFSR